MKVKGNIAELEYKTVRSGAFDLSAAIDVILMPGEWAIVPTGIYLDLESCDDDDVLLILPRSGLALNNGIIVLNSPGLIDGDYPGQLGVIAYNVSSEPYKITAGDRIAQVLKPVIDRVENIPTRKVNRDGGFGSTGKN